MGKWPILTEWQIGKLDEMQENGQIGKLDEMQENGQSGQT